MDFNKLDKFLNNAKTDSEFNSLLINYFNMLSDDEKSLAMDMIVKNPDLLRCLAKLFVAKKEAMQLNNQAKWQSVLKEQETILSGEGNDTTKIVGII